MQGNSIEVSKNMYTYNGWYLATLEGTEEVKTAKGIWTVAQLRVEGSNSKYPESLYLTNNEDAPDNRACSMLVEAFGGQPIPKGTPAATIMSQIGMCLTKKCSVLMLPKLNPKDGKNYHRFTDDYSVKSVQNAAVAGTTFDGEVKVDKPKVTKAEDATPDF